MLYIDSTFVTTSLPNIIPEPTTELEITQDFLGEREKIFSIMTNPENYPKVLPQNIKSVKIIEDFDNKILAEYEVVEAGITSKLLVQHRMSPYYEHTQLASGQNRWELPTDFTGDKDPRIYQTPINYEDSTQLFTLDKVWLGNDNSDSRGSIYNWGYGGEPGIQFRKATYEDISNQSFPPSQL